MVGHAGSAVRIVYVDMTLTRSKVKVNDTGLLKIVIVIARRPQEAVHAGGDDRQPRCEAFYLSYYYT